jgi:hypothetical protein
MYGFLYLILTRHKFPLWLGWDLKKLKSSEKYKQESFPFSCAGYPILGYSGV